MNWIIFGLFLMIGPLARAQDISQTPLSFDEALSTILARSTAIATQKANLGASEAKLLPAQFAFAPSLSFDAKQSWTNPGLNFLDATKSKQLEAVSNLNLFHWGADWANLKSAQFDELTQKQALDAAWLNVEDDAVRALIAQTQRKKEISINREVVKIEEELLSIAQQRYRAGLLPIQEVNKVSVDLENSQSNLVESQLKEIEANNNLENLLGHSRVQEDWPWKSRMAQDSADLINKRLFNPSQRPDWKAASSRVEAEDQRYKRNLRLLLPSLDGSFAYGYYNDSGVGGHGWTAALSITLPFFDHMETYSKARVQFYNRIIAETALTQTERDAKSEWQSNRNAFEIAMKTVASREKTLQTSLLLFQDSQRRFKAGRATANDLAEDQRRLLNSEVYSIQAWATAHLAYTRLCHSLGMKVLDCK